MPLIGNIVKGALKISSGVDLNLKGAADKQRSALGDLLDSAKHTAFGKYYDFDGILKANDIGREFKNRVPIFSYEQMHERWWHQQLKYKDITWPGRPKFYARSSGTTGDHSKRIPITDDFISSMRKVGFDLLKTVPSYNLANEVFESEVLTISSSANLNKSQKGHLEGEISGINIYNLPDWLDIIYRPGKDIARIEGWDERLSRIVDEAPGWNVGAIAGIPSWVLEVLKAIVKKYDVPSIKAIWPNLSVFMSGGVAFGTYRESFEKICGKDLKVIDTYLASEGFFAFSDQPGKMDMRLALDHGYYYEFIPFDERGFDELGNLLEDPEVISLEHVELDQEYALLASTCAGAWRYMIGDTIKFTSLDPHRILLTGRTKFFLNIAGSQLSEEKLDAGINHLSEYYGAEINEYSVSVLKNDDDEYYHQWIVVSDDPFSEQEFMDRLDKKLKSLNRNYEVARGKALKAVRMTRINRSTYLKYIKSQKKLGGQVKVPKVMDAEKMSDYLNYINGVEAE